MQKMPSLRLFNTETRKLETIQARENRTISLYTCGPTIYDFAHIGNFRTFVCEDLLRRTLLFFGFSVVQAMNLTDIDDKTIQGAIRSNQELKDYTAPYQEAFFQDLKALNIQSAEYYPAATQYISQMIEMIQKLLDEKIAYSSPNGSVYFSVQKFPSYGKLSHFCLDELKVNASGDNEMDDREKDHPSDFVLWKAYDPTRDGKIYWESPWGHGRPGWHIECSAMSMQLLGPVIDIHCGGVDNMFPHHENEIAQSECYSGHRFVCHWFHVDHLLVEQKKMSKSLGNFYTLRDLLQRGYSGSQVRYLLLSTHYRSPLNFTFQGLDAARSSLTRLADFIRRLRLLEEKKEEEDLQQFLSAAELQFQTALADDLNISAALAAVFDLVRELNSRSDSGLMGRRGADQTLSLLAKWNQVLGFLPFEQEKRAPQELNELLVMRERARVEKNWSLSDQIRDQIHEQGYLIEDGPMGSRLKKKDL